MALFRERPVRTPFEPHSWPQTRAGKYESPYRFFPVNSGPAEAGADLSGPVCTMIAPRSPA
ncbi:MAG: hypothetical protein LUQ25_09555 [Methanoregulaceae archaeon]|nr:hypothetical protein [Methanoregulaceae archaeon]